LWNTPNTKVVPVLKYAASHARRGIEVQLHAFLTSALGEYKWWASSSSYFTHGGRAPDTHWTGGWVGHTASLGVL